MTRLRIVVLGAMARHPFAGQTWLFLGWLRGLAALGHEVWYVEDAVEWPYDGGRHTYTDDWTYARQHIAGSMERIGLGDHWAVRCSLDEGACWGRSSGEIDDLYRTCDLLLNVVGTRLREPHMKAPFRVYVETDPVTHELRWAEGDDFPRAHFAEHDAIATYGENYAAADCGVPLNGVDFITTRQPVDLELWPAAVTPDASCFTTIGNYRQSGKDVTYRGETYHWSKHHEWERFIDLPSRVAQRFRLAVNADRDDRTTLEAHGWEVVSPLDMSLDVFGAYPEFIRASRAELTVAKDQNVRLRSGWFSERDACYLASAKPVVAQDTGFSNVLPTGDGLFAVRDVDGAAAAVDEINRRYEHHARAARELAREHFEASAVCARLLADLGVG